MGIDMLTKSGIRVTSISEKIHVIHGKNRGRSPFSHSFLILDTAHVLFDSGCGLDVLETVIRTCGIDLVVNSHSHPDHTAGNWLLQELCDPGILVPKECSDSISSAELLGYRFVGTELAALWRERYLPVTGFRDFSLSESFSHGREVITGSLRFIAVHSPGHLLDHYCFYEPDEKILLGFDIDLSPFGPWYGHRESDIPTFRKSIEQASTMPVTTYFYSHARPVKGPYVSKRLESYASIFEARNSILCHCIPRNKPVNLTSLVDRSPFYGTDHSVGDLILRYGEEQMIIKHLQRLIDDSRVIESEDGFMLKS